MTTTQIHQNPTNYETKLSKQSQKPTKIIQKIITKITTTTTTTKHTHTQPKFTKTRTRPQPKHHYERLGFLGALNQKR